MTKKEMEIYEYAKEIYSGRDSFDGNHAWKYSHTERCVEVPWVADALRRFEITSLLDVGFTFASHDYLRFILDFSKTYDLNGVDIIEPQSVINRYPAEWVDDVMEVEFYNYDISLNHPQKKYEAVSLISTLEHIGFDKKSVSVEGSAFERARNKNDVVAERDPEIEKKVFGNIAESLNPNGILLVSVPCGKGGSVVLQDSMGLYTSEYEYSAESWGRIRDDVRFTCIEERFFIEDEQGVWKERSTIEELKGVSAEMKEYASGVGVCILRKEG